MPTGVVDALASEKHGRWFSFDDRKVGGWMPMGASNTIIAHSSSFVVAPYPGCMVVYSKHGSVVQYLRGMICSVFVGLLVGQARAW